MLVRKSKLSRVERINAIVEMTNLKLQDWYENAKLDYGVIGSGYCETCIFSILTKKSMISLLLKMDFIEGILMI